jgi:hypothetical protein
VRDVLHDRPTAAELVDAVREFLATDVLTSTEGRTQFHTRVAINVLAMVHRELTDDGTSELHHRERLAELGVLDDDQLALAIRNKQLDDRMAEVIVAVQESVDAKLRVANPRHFLARDGRPGSG